MYFYIKNYKIYFLSPVPYPGQIRVYNTIQLELVINKSEFYINYLKY